jgi:hypothetical protein
MVSVLRSPSPDLVVDLVPGEVVASIDYFLFAKPSGITSISLHSSASLGLIGVDQLPPCDFRSREMLPALAFEDKRCPKIRMLPHCVRTIKQGQLCLAHSVAR